jgi:hypothetical protein
MGRPSKLTDAQKAEARRWRAEGATLAELARSYDVSRSMGAVRIIYARTANFALAARQFVSKQGNRY